MIKLKEELKKLKWTSFIFLTIAGIVNAIGINLFLSPVSLYDSGISGTSMFLANVFNTNLPNLTFFVLPFFLVILNVPIFLFGLKKQGIQFTIYSIYTVAIYSICSFLITDVIPIDVSSASPLAKSDLLLCAMFGGLLSGVGSGLAIRYGGAMDGIEVLAVIFSKKLGITVGTFVMIFNVILYVIAGFVTKDWIKPLYSIVTYVVGIKAVDFIIYGLDKSKAAMIITMKQQEVCEELASYFGKGMTIIDAKGFYSNTDKKVIYLVVNRFQIVKMKDIVHSIDSTAFITISEVTDIYRSNIEK